MFLIWSYHTCDLSRGANRSNQAPPAVAIRTYFPSARRCFEELSSVSDAGSLKTSGPHGIEPTLNLTVTHCEAFGCLHILCVELLADFRHVARLNLGLLDVLLHDLFDCSTIFAFQTIGLPPKFGTALQRFRLAAPFLRIPGRLQSLYQVRAVKLRYGAQQLPHEPAGGAVSNELSRRGARNSTHAQFL